MREVILSHDSEAVVYLVPRKVADDLNRYRRDFAADRVWNGPEKDRFLHKLKGGTFGVVFGAPDLIDYLSRFLFPHRPAKRVKGLGWHAYELPDEYKAYPRCNF